ncbi:MAG: DUF3567 domain-containing protein [Paucibacter sp.]|nr:DUF3567 domain-containing protein [Roseateles sp.]
MQMLYNSPSYVVVQFDVQVDSTVNAELLDANPDWRLSRGGFEIVDKFARKEIFIEGALAEAFQDGVTALIETEPSEEEIDDFIQTYANLGNQPVVMH